jgi:GNAT superfamily N-acetyltransferase
MNLVLEPGRPEDAAVAARLIAETDADLFRYYCGGDLSGWIAISQHEWRHPRGIYCYALADVVRAGTAIQGLIVSYSGKQQYAMDWTLGSSAPHVSADLMSKVQSVRRTASLLFPTIPDDVWYVQNLVVVPEAQGTGLGTFLMETVFARARTAGYRTCHLDVDSSRPAVQFYQRLGMSVLVETRVPSIPGVHTHYRMVKSLMA